ncbi:uncharacterized protein BO97DRAFT_404643 [Aspergillus homomorphus CBS 101889]|uniref:Uncharacterized protein n=1 Tax=Aspergillus homomorphus (strain CBS 101889) TaxID=1450537 RepID=A0A395I3T1_ASPHC|nr:hypothetical protein BO97DRAFT_404643 [Aspergillus homomorphus CBS 101889]RAL13848.1 hypothetical protein BO97DRAFT_404643 [Aspergillus homomorphus CBS 101889]
MNGNTVIAAILLPLLLSLIVGAYLFNIWWSKQLRDRGVRHRQGAHELVTLTQSNTRAGGRRWVEVRVRESGNDRLNPAPQAIPEQATRAPPRRERDTERRVETQKNDDQWPTTFPNDDNDNNPPHPFHDVPAPVPAPQTPNQSPPSSWHQPQSQTWKQSPERQQEVEELRGNLQAAFAEHRNSRAGSKVDHRANKENEWEMPADKNPAGEPQTTEW